MPIVKLLRGRCSSTGLKVSFVDSSVWSIVSPDQSKPFCRSSRDNKNAMSVCLIDGLDVYLMYTQELFSPPKCDPAQSGGSQLSRSAE